MGKIKNPDVRFPAIRPGLYQDLGIVLILKLLSVACLNGVGLFFVVSFCSLVLGLWF